jgi:hypothetical protein
VRVLQKGTYSSDAADTVAVCVECVAHWDAFEAVAAEVAVDVEAQKWAEVNMLGTVAVVEVMAALGSMKAVAEAELLVGIAIVVMVSASRPGSVAAGWRAVGLAKQDDSGAVHANQWVATGWRPDAQDTEVVVEDHGTDALKTQKDVAVAAPEHIGSAGLHLLVLGLEYSPDWLVEADMFGRKAEATVFAVETVCLAKEVGVAIAVVDAVTLRIVGRDTVAAVARWWCGRNAVTNPVADRSRMDCFGVDCWASGKYFGPSL